MAKAGLFISTAKTYSNQNSTAQHTQQQTEHHQQIEQQTQQHQPHQWPEQQQQSRQQQQPRLVFFDKVLADVGDSQNLQQSLSTFSGHIKRVRSILEEATPHSLVLLDEVSTSLVQLPVPPLATPPPLLQASSICYSDVCILLYV